MSDDREAEALFQRGDLVRLEGKVRRVMTSFVSVDLPEPWAPASFSLPPESVAEGQPIGVAGTEDPNFASGKLKGMRVQAVRLESEGASRYLVVHHADEGGGAGGSGSPAPGTPNKDDMDWSDL